MADWASASTLHTTPDSLRSTGRVTALCTSIAPAFRVTQPPATAQIAQMPTQRLCRPVRPASTPSRGVQARRVIGLLVDRGQWDPLRSTVLLAYYESYADWHRMREQVRGREVVLQGGKRTVDEQGQVTTEGGKAVPMDTCSDYADATLVEGLFERDVDLRTRGRRSQTDLLAFVKSVHGPGARDL